MLKYFENKYALTEQGAKDLVKGIVLTVFVNISKLLPVGALSMALTGIINALTNNTDVKEGLGRFVVFGILSLIMLFITFYLQYKALYNATYDESANRRIRLAEILRKLPLSFFGNRDLTDLTSTIMSDCEALEKAFSHFIPQMLGTYISTIILSIAMLIYNWKMGIALLWVIPVALGIIFGTRKLERKAVNESIDVRRKATDSMQEVLECIQEIKACNQKEEFLKDVDEKLDLAEKATINAELVTGTCVTVSQAFLKIGIATTVLVGVSLYSRGQLGLNDLLIYLMASTRLYDPLGSLFANMAAVLAFDVRLERMKAIENEAQMIGLTEYAPENYDITFDNVTFAYRENEDVLRNVSFTAKQGEVTALVGPSGGGKSTATKLAARFWDPSEGKVTIGGIDIKTIDGEALLENYAIVFQDVTLFADTVMENIRLGKKDATDEEVIAAAKVAQCDEFVSKLPDGYNTMIGENGSRLSGGERQRISIARAVLKDAPVILLDEATASLDVENETAVQTALSSLIKDKTVLIIAHRMRTVMNADKIVVLENGTVSQSGKPEDLLKEEGSFARMVKLQNESTNWVAN